jgi:hypothetical protein
VLGVVVAEAEAEAEADAEAEAEPDAAIEAGAEAVRVATAVPPVAAVAVVGGVRAVGRADEGDVALTEVAALTEGVVAFTGLLEVMAFWIALQSFTTALLHLAFCTASRSVSK